MTHDPNCIFCRIIAGELPCVKVYEDDDILGFLDIRPLRPGHTLLVPKRHVDHFMDLDDSVATRIVLVGQALSRQIRKTLKPARVGVVVNGYGVAHTHYHLIPLDEPHDITARAYSFIEDGKVVFDAGRIPVASQDDREKIAAQIRLGAL
jgi:histidine triad (HIT) family protein